MNTEKGFLTVGQLKALIADHHDDVQIVVADEEGNYFNIESTRPADDEGNFAITLFTADTFDARQF
jgi:hypothetical protein